MQRPRLLESAGRMSKGLLRKDLDLLIEVFAGVPAPQEIALQAFLRRNCLGIDLNALHSDRSRNSLMASDRFARRACCSADDSAISTIGLLRSGASAFST